MLIAKSVYNCLLSRRDRASPHFIVISGARVVKVIQRLVLKGMPLRKAALIASLIVLLAAVCSPETPRPAAPSTIRFEEIAKSAGINFVTNSSPTANKNQPETMVGGVALLDYDGDGYLDIYVVNGAAIPSLDKDGPQDKKRL